MAVQPLHLSLKPDFADAVKRWEAFHAKSMLDRPIICVTSPKRGCEDNYVNPPGSTYYERVHQNFDYIIDRAILTASRAYYGGEAIPVFITDFSPDEIALFLNAELAFSKDSGDTSWSVPFVMDWKDVLPLQIDETNVYWQRMVALYQRAAERLSGQMLIAPLDLHTNMDLLSAIRSPQKLCIDLIEQPDLIDLAMADARKIFHKIWNTISETGRMRENGYCQLVYAMEGAAMLQCDFSYMISPKMFDQWVLPALEEEAQIVKHPFYHWDGPGALSHFTSLMNTPYIDVFSYVPGEGVGPSIKRLDVLKRIQEAGKAVHAWGTADELKFMHNELKPDRVIYTTSVSTQSQAEELLEWFTNNT